MLGITKSSICIDRLIELTYELQVRAWLMLDETRSIFGGNSAITSTRSAAQTLVEWSIVAAVMALIGITAWQAAGTAITDAINRAVANLAKAG
jgi:hypothetical protein